MLWDKNPIHVWMKTERKYLSFVDLEPFKVGQSFQEVPVYWRKELVQSLLGVTNMATVMQVHQEGKYRGELQRRGKRIWMQYKKVPQAWHDACIVKWDRETLCVHILQFYLVQKVSDT